MAKLSSLFESPVFMRRNVLARAVHQYRSFAPPPLKLRCLGFFGFDASRDRVESGCLSFLDRRFGISDREGCLPFQLLGIILGEASAHVVLDLRNFLVPRCLVGGNLCFQRIPKAGDVIAGRLDVSIQPSESCSNVSACLLLDRDKLVMSFLLSLSNGILSVLRSD